MEIRASVLLGKIKSIDYEIRKLKIERSSVEYELVVELAKTDKFHLLTPNYTHLKYEQM